MPDPNFAPAERRPYLIPIVVALAALACAVLIGIHFYPATTVNIDHSRSAILLTSTTFKSDTNIVGASHDETQLFIAETLRVENQLRDPIFLNDFILTVKDQNDAELTVRALEKSDLEAVQTTFPKLAPLATSPLLRETSIDPGKSAEGTVVFSVHLTNAIWDTRKSAVVKVDLYHRNPVYLTIPTTPITPKP